MTINKQTAPKKSPSWIADGYQIGSGSKVDSPPAARKGIPKDTTVKLGSKDVLVRGARTPDEAGRHQASSTPERRSFHSASHKLLECLQQPWKGTQYEPIHPQSTFLPYNRPTKYIPLPKKMRFKANPSFEERQLRPKSAQNFHVVRPRLHPRPKSAHPGLHVQAPKPCAHVEASASMTEINVDPLSWYSLASRAYSEEMAKLNIDPPTDYSWPDAFFLEYHARCLNQANFRVVSRQPPQGWVNAVPDRRGVEFQEEFKDMRTVDAHQLGEMQRYMTRPQTAPPMTRQEHLVSQLRLQAQMDRPLPPHFCSFVQKAHLNEAYSRDRSPTRRGGYSTMDTDEAMCSAWDYYTGETTPKERKHSKNVYFDYDAPPTASRMHEIQGQRGGISGSFDVNDFDAVQSISEANEPLSDNLSCQHGGASGKAGRHGHGGASTHGHGGVSSRGRRGIGADSGPHYKIPDNVDMYGNSSAKSRKDRKNRKLDSDYGNGKSKHKKRKSKKNKGGSKEAISGIRLENTPSGHFGPNQHTNEQEAATKREIKKKERRVPDAHAIRSGRGRGVGEAPTENDHYDDYDPCQSFDDAQLIPPGDEDSSILLDKTSSPYIITAPSLPTLPKGKPEAAISNSSQRPNRQRMLATPIESNHDQIRTEIRSDSRNTESVKVIESRRQAFDLNMPAMQAPVTMHGKAHYYGDAAKETEEPAPAWQVEGRLALSQQSSRFTLPIDMMMLEKINAVEYLKKFCILSQRRNTLYKHIFQRYKNHKTGNLSSRKELEKALKEVLVHSITSREVKKLCEFVDLEIEEKGVEFKVFAGIAGIAERLLYPKFLTENTEDIREFQKGRIESADFSAIEWKLHGVNINPTVKRVLDALVYKQAFAT